MFNQLFNLLNDKRGKTLVLLVRFVCLIDPIKFSLNQRLLKDNLNEVTND